MFPWIVPWVCSRTVAPTQLPELHIFTHAVSSMHTAAASVKIMQQSSDGWQQVAAGWKTWQAIRFIIGHGAIRCKLDASCEQLHAALPYAMVLTGAPHQANIETANKHHKRTGQSSSKQACMDWMQGHNAYTGRFKQLRNGLVTACSSCQLIAW